MAHILQCCPKDGPAKNEVGNKEKNIPVHVRQGQDAKGLVVQHHAQHKENAAHPELSFFGKKLSIKGEGLFLFLHGFFGSPHFLPDFRRRLHLIALFRKGGDQAVRVLCRELHSFRGIGNGSGENAGLTVNQLFQFQRAGSAVQGRDFIGFSPVGCPIHRRHNAHRFINASAYCQYFPQKLIRILFGNKAELLGTERNGSKENRGHFPNLPFHLSGTFHTVQMFHVVHGAVVRISKEIAAAAVKAFPADVAVLFLHTFMVVAVRCMTFPVVDS